MGRQRNNLQWKGKEESPEKELSETEASKLSDIEFKIMLMRMLRELSDNHKELSGSYKECSGNFSSTRKDIENMNKNQEEMKSTIVGIKNRLDEAEDWISKL